MIFTVYYRENSGQKASLELDVSTKEDIWPELRKRGINAISVSEGASPKKRSKPSERTKPLIIGIIGISAVIAVSIFLLKSDLISDKKEKVKADKKEAAQKPLEIKKEKADDTVSRLAEKADQETRATTTEPALRQNIQKPTYTPARRVITNSVANTVKSKYDVFEHRVEGELAFLACMPLGTMVIGSREFDETFMKELAKSLDSEIKISDEDNDEVRYYKQSVIDLKKEIREMLRNGEDVAEALSHSRKELQELGVYKTQLQIQLNELMSKGDEISDTDVQDFVSAANLMLSEKGIEPFHFNSLTRTILRNKPLAESSSDEADTERSNNE